MRSIIILLVVALIGLQYKLWFSDSSILEWMRVEQKLAAQERENKKLLKRNLALEADIVELKSGEQALEEHARFELGMVKNGEAYYHFIESE